jgi:membrane protein DedA with SNARE-associated domain
MDFLSLHYLIQLLHTYGYAVLCIVIALECVGAPLPGETLLIVAAVIAGTSHQMNIVLVILLAALSAIVGQGAGYWIGWGVGFRLLRRYGGYIGMTGRRLAFGRALFRRHGGKVVIVSRFIIVVRTLAALLAGANHMPWPRFMAANVAGSVVWATLYGCGAYALGHAAKTVAGPAGIAIGCVATLGLVAGVLYMRRTERQMLHSQARAARSANKNRAVTLSRG